MLLRRLAIELPALFSMDLPREGQRGQAWCFVVILDHGKHCPLLSPPPSTKKPFFLEFPKLNAPISSTIGKNSQHSMRGSVVWDLICIQVHRLIICTGAPAVFIGGSSSTLGIAQ